MRRWPWDLTIASTSRGLIGWLRASLVLILRTLLLALWFGHQFWLMEISVTRLTAARCPKIGAPGIFLLRRRNLSHNCDLNFPWVRFFTTNKGLRDWAFDLTKNLELMDSSEFQALREAYVDHPAARRPPFVLTGGHLAAMTYWHGAC